MAIKNRPRRIETPTLPPNANRYRIEFCLDLIQHMAEGFSFESFAGLKRVSRTTLYNWAKAHEEFADAKGRAFAACLYWWEQQGISGLYDRVESTGKGKDKVTITTRLNPVVWRLNMANRFGWREQQEVVTPEPTKPDLQAPYRELDKLTVEELKTLRDLLQKMEGDGDGDGNGKSNGQGKPVVN